MAFDISRLGEIVGQHLGEKPHPDVPELKVNQYATFGRIAARLFDTNTPEPRQVQQAFHSIDSVGVSPAEFERIWDTARPLANVLIQRDPTLHDVMALVGHQPAEIHAFYMQHPHPDYPEVAAGDMSKYRAVATPIARRLHGRDPNHVELGRFALGRYSIDDVMAHYMDDGSAPQAPQQQAGGADGPVA